MLCFEILLWKSGQSWETFRSASLLERLMISARPPKTLLPEHSRHLWQHGHRIDSFWTVFHFSMNYQKKLWTSVGLEAGLRCVPTPLHCAPCAGKPQDKRRIWANVYPAWRSCMGHGGPCRSCLACHLPCRCPCPCLCQHPFLTPRNAEFWGHHGAPFLELAHHGVRSSVAKLTPSPFSPICWSITLMF